MVTVQEMIEQAREREALFKERETLFKRAKKGVRKERLEGIKRIFQMPTRVPTPIRKRDIRFTGAARKAVSLVAPKGSMIRAITTPKKKGKRGRGRPRGTYRTRVLPSGRVVKVPTHIYKKMLSQEKAQMRLIRAQKQAQAEQLAMQTDARYIPDMAEERFLEEPDETHEMAIMRAQQQAEIARLRGEQPQLTRRPGIIRRISERQPTEFDEFGRPVGMFQVGQIGDFGPREPRVTMIKGMVREPRVTAVSYKSNLLAAPTRINAFGQSTLLY